MERTRRTLSVIAALGIVMPLAACNGDPESTTPPSTSGSRSASPTPSATTPSTTPKPTPPPIPPAAINGLTVTSAEAFARFYLAAIDYAEETGDATLMRRYADRACTACSAIAKGHETTYKAGGAVTGDFQTRNIRATSVRLAGADTAALSVSGAEGLSQWRKSASADPISYPPHRVAWDLVLAAVGGHWTMFAMVRK